MRLRATVQKWQRQTGAFQYLTSRAFRVAGDNNVCPQTTGIIIKQTTSNSQKTSPKPEQKHKLLEQKSEFILLAPELFYHRSNTYWVRRNDSTADLSMDKMKILVQDDNWWFHTNINIYWWNYWYSNTNWFQHISTDAIHTGFKPRTCWSWVTHILHVATEWEQILHWEWKQ